MMLAVGGCVEGERDNHLWRRAYASPPSNLANPQQYLYNSGDTRFLQFLDSCLFCCWLMYRLVIQQRERHQALQLWPLGKILLESDRLPAAISHAYAPVGSLASLPRAVTGEIASRFTNKPVT